MDTEVAESPSRRKDSRDGGEASSSGHETLKYSLLGPSLLKAGQDSVDQDKVSDVIYNASKGSKYFDREEAKDKELSAKIDQILANKAQLERLDLSRDLRLADALVAELESSRDLSQHIVHVDCDAFYAAVELLGRPELANVPFAVGGGVLTTCNYVARRFGCRSGMASFVAKKLCPQLVVLKPDFAKYSAKAQEVREVLARYDARFESASIDEAYLNVTEYCAARGLGPAEVVAQLRREVAEKAKVTVSAGIAANTRLAKICSNINKPNGQYVLRNDRSTIVEFMRDLPCRKVNGVGRVFERELSSVGIKTCGDIYGQRQFLRRLFGDKACHFLLRCYLGLGRTKVQPAAEYERKSVGTESTFASISDPEQLRQKLRWTANELEKDLRRAECKGRTLVLKVKLDTFEVYTRQIVPSQPLCSADDLYKHAVPILAKLEQEMTGVKIRLMGLRCTHLVSTKKPDALAFWGLKIPHAAEPHSVDPLNAGPGGGPLDLASDWDVRTVGGEQSGRITDSSGADEQPLPGELSPGAVWQGSLEELLGELPEASSIGQHGREITANPKVGGQLLALRPDEWWHCPVCLRPQPADERQFNCHIDTCLSRRTILEAVQENTRDQRVGNAGFRHPSRGKKTSRTVTDKKRARRPTTTGDPRQKKICFGEIYSGG